MTFIFPIAIVVLSFVIYSSSAISFFPIGISYLLFLYSLKDLQESKMKKAFFLFGILGLLVSLLGTNLLIIHDVILSVIISLLAYVLDKHNYYIQIPVFIIVLCLFIGHYISSKNLWLAGLFVFAVCLYFLHQNTNVFLQNESYEKRNQRIQQISPILQLCLLIVTSVLSLFLYQEYHFQLNQEYYDAIYYTIESSSDNFEYPYNPKCYLSNLDGYYNSESLFTFMKVPNRYLDYQTVEFYVYTDHEVDWTRYENRNQSDKPADETVPIYQFFEKTSYTKCDIEALFKYDQPLRVSVVLDNGIYPAESFEKDAITLTKHNALFKGRSLFTKAYMIYDGKYEVYMPLDFSVYISHLVHQTTEMDWSVYQVSKETKEKVLIDSYVSDSSYSINIQDNTKNIYVNNAEGFDFEKYDYEVSYTLYNEYGDVLFKDQVVVTQ